MSATDVENITRQRLTAFPSPLRLKIVGITITVVMPISAELNILLHYTRLAASFQGQVGNAVPERCHQSVFK